MALDDQVSAIRSLLDAAHEASASKWAQQGAAVPLPDDRADEEQEAESEVRKQGGKEDLGPRLEQGYSCREGLAGGRG